MTKSSEPAPSSAAHFVDRVAIDVEAGKIREFARATHAEDPVHIDKQSAALAGFDDVLATATHVVVAGHLRNQQEFVASLGLAIERVVVGSVDWEYMRPLVAGDHLTGTRRVVEDVVRENKRGGRMRLVTLETDWSEPEGDIAVRQRETLIEKGPQ